MRRNPCAILLGLLFLAGCATRAAIDPNIQWNSRVGSYTYEQTVAELGKPDAVSGLGDGSHVAEWITGRSPRLSFGFGVGGGSYGPHGGAGVGAGTAISPPAHSKALRLTFGPDGKLLSWMRTGERR